MVSTIEQNSQFVKGNNGFTLIEVLIALVIFSLGILGVAALQSGSINGNTSARGVTDIALVATDRLEMLRSLPYDDPALAAGVYDLDPVSDRIDNNYNGMIDETMPTNETGPLTIQYTVTTDWPIQRTKTVTVTVTHDGAAVQKAVTMQQIIPLIL